MMTEAVPIELGPESRWSKPNDWCPHPERWTSTDPQSTEVEVSALVAGFVRALQPDYVIETGSCLGQTTLAIATALAMNGQGHLDTLEIDPERAAFTRARLMHGLVDARVTVHEVSSLDFAPRGSVGFAWLDSRFELRVPEFERYRDWMGPGTIVGFHDTAPHHGLWGDDIGRLAGVHQIKLRTPRGVTFVEVL